MAASIDLTQFRAEDVRSTKRVISGVYTGPASYVAGGDPIAPGEVKLGQIHFLDFDLATNGTIVLLVVYDYTNLKAKWFDMAGVEVAGATALNAYTARFEAVGL